MNKIKMFFKYLWENLFDRYSIVVLNVYNAITFFAMLYLWYWGIKSTSGGALWWFFAIVTLTCINLILFTILAIIFFFESKGKIKRIKNNPVLNNKFYRVISLISILKVFFYYLLLIYCIFWIFAVLLEDIIRP